MTFSIVVAETGGFCWGVKRAILGALGKRKRVGEPIFVFGHLVHNEIAVADLEESEVHVLTNLDEARARASGKVILITAHGLDPAIRRELEVIGKEVVDMTCPIVENVHQAARELRAQGLRMVLIGTPRSHPEVQGIIGVLEKDVFLVEQLSATNLIPYPADAEIGIVAQTTFNEEAVRELVRKIQERFKNAVYLSKPSIVNPDYESAICDDISLKQKELRAVAPSCDRVIVVGSVEKSANSRHLADIAKEELCAKTAFILVANHLDPHFTHGAKRVFVTAGASTPASSVRGVIKRLEEMGGIRE
ncbi:MAG: 4-hydroxy-3-methylbut-2-enyl diphosphate reductase [bacterium]|nr:4-hydroxy-3-methylbut-2-enyl diphosphate reductase [bacterium]